MGGLNTLFLSVLGLAPILVSGWAQNRPNECVVSSQYLSSKGTADDSPAISEALARCASDSVIVFEEGVDYNVFSPISAKNLSNVEIQMNGNLHLPQNITAIQTLVKKTSSKKLIWFQFAGENVDYSGSANVSTGWINSYGQAWWDANPVNGTGTAFRPHLMSIDFNHGTIKHLKSRKPIAWNFIIKGDDIVITDTIIDAYSTGAFPFNTDGFDVSGTNIRISDSVIYNGDDAIAVGSGSSNIVFERAAIGYQSHGMSIGSLGENQAEYATVSNVLFDDVTVIDAVYAARFKSWMGGQGLAKNIQWSNIRVYNVTFPIFVTQSYFNQNSGSGAGRPNNSSVMMEDFTWSDFTGTINTYNPGDGSCASDPCWYNVGLPDLKHTEAIIIECNTDTSCENFVTNNIQIIPQSMAPPTTICMNATASLNPHLGFVCENATYIPTELW